MTSALGKWLRHAKQVRLPACFVRPQRPFTLVTGNESCDLDSATCAIATAFFSSLLQSHIPTYIPLLAIPRQDLFLRPELLHLFSITGISSDDICTLDDVNTIDISKTNLFLVDHNRPRGTIATFYDFDRHPERKSLVQGIIDHHVDENFFDESQRTKMMRHDIRTTGSCASLVTQYIMGLPSAQSLSPTPETTKPTSPENTPEIRVVAQLLISAILIDTSNLTNKVTSEDTLAVQFLSQYLPELSLDNYFSAMKAAKDSIGGMSLVDLLRRDYKEFDTRIGKLGMSTILRSIPFLQSHFPDFEKTVKEYRQEHSLEVFVVLTVWGEGDEFRRGGMMVTEKYSSVIEEFKRRGREKYDVKKDGEGRGMYNCFVFEVGDLSASRKQIAPLVMGIMEKVEREE